MSPIVFSPQESHIATFKQMLHQWFPRGGVRPWGAATNFFGGAWDILGKIYGKTELITILKMSQHL
jgi:hypothetical protein